MAITLTYLKINITQKELFYFSKTLKLNPNIYKVKLLMRLNDRNDVINNDMFDIFTNSCFTLQTKEETVKSLELFNLFYGKNIIYYKTLLNFISCIRYIALNRNIEKKVKKLLKYLFCKITKKIKK